MCIVLSDPHRPIMPATVAVAKRCKGDLCRFLTPFLNDAAVKELKDIQIAQKEFVQHLQKMWKLTDIALHLLLTFYTSYTCSEFFGIFFWRMEQQVWHARSVSLNGGSWHKQSGEHNGPFCLHSICCPTCFFLLHSTFVCTSSLDSFYKVSSGWLEVAFSMLHPSFICLYVQSKALEIPDVKMFQWKQMC